MGRARSGASPVPASHTESVKQIWTGKVTEAAVRYGEHAPMATACCNACRACVTTNALGLLAAGVGTITVAARRLLSR